MKICGIYKITHKDSGKSYVGLSIDIVSRWKQHRSFAKHNGRSAICNAIRKYGVESFSFEVLEECLPDDLEQKERFWIEKLNTVCDGYNLTFGGESNKEVSFETRAKMSASQSGKKQSEETKQKRISKIKGLKRTAEQNAQKSKLMKGRGAGRKLPDWVVEKIGKPFLGRKHSPESIEKMSQAKKGVVFTEEHKNRLSESHKGYKFSEERKLKHSVALKAYWEKRKAEKELYG
jgi:group I intron endonuclease